MTLPVLVFTRSEALLSELNTQLEGKAALVACDNLEALHRELKAQGASAVVVHFDRATTASYSPGRLIAELDEAIENAPLYGLVDVDCAPRLRKLAHKACDDCLEFPLDYSRIRRLLIEKQDVEGELAGFWKDLPHKELKGQSRSLVTFTPEMFETMEEIHVAARHNVTVLLIGETGSGKTFLARLIHELSDRRDERLCTVACGALPPDLIESELFGYVKGAFTGADRDREGKFAAAGRGTLLLDEIDVLPPEQQAKLLRVIETGEYEPVGSNETRHSQARLIVASNYNLEELVRAGNFRTDLYYRLNILNFHLLPLRQRPWDIEFLARKFAIEHSKAHDITLRAIEPAFLDTLRHYHWPGNIREMENVIRRAVLYCHRGVLTVSDLPSSIRSAAYANSVSGEYASQEAASGMMERGMGNMERPVSAALPPSMGAHLRPSPAVATATMGPVPTGNAPLPLRANFPMNAAQSTAPAYAGQQPLSTPNYVGESAQAANRLSSVSLEARVDVLERRIIEDCLQRNNFRRKETAAELGISRVTLYNKMKKFGLL